VRLSAHVPDELWAKAAALHPEPGPSRLVQLALRRLVERSRPRFAPERDGHQQRLLQLRRSRVAQLAQGAYDQGYEAGLRFCETLAWADLERLAASNWNLGAVVASGDSRLASSSYRSGMRDALRDAWLGALRT
jgi:hypothetical protein